MSLDPHVRPRPALGLDAGHFRSVRGLLTAGRVGATLAGSAWMVLTLAALGGGSGAGFVVILAVLAALAYLGGVITEIVGWFGLRGLDGNRGWATSVAVLFIIECSWAFIFPIFLVAAGGHPIGLLAATMLFVASRCALVAGGFWARRGAAARVAAFAYSLAATAWLAFGVASLTNTLTLPGFGVAAFIIGALCEAIGHFATGAYFAENRPVPVDVSAFT